MSYDPSYFDRLKESLNNFIHNQSGDFNEKTIFDMRDKLTKLLEEDRQRDQGQHGSSQVRSYIENTINFIIYTLDHIDPQVSKNSPKYNIRHATLEVLSKKPLSSQLNPSVIDLLVVVIEKDNENNAGVAIRIIHDVIRQIQNQPQQLQRHNQIIQDSTLLRLYEFCEKRIEFLLDFNRELTRQNYKRIKGDTALNPFADPTMPISEQNTEHRDSTVRLNNQSLSFITNIPQLFMFTMVVLDQYLKEETRNKMRDILKKTLKTMNQAINEMNLQEILTRVPRSITQDIYNILSKFLQFFLLVLKKDVDQSNQQRVLRDLSDQIKLDNVVSLIIKIIKTCPVELIAQRIDISNRLKHVLQQKREPIPNEQINERMVEIQSNVAELIDEETILGKNLKLSSYTKQFLSQNWLETIKFVVLNYLPKPEQSQGQPPQQPPPIERMQNDFLNNLVFMEKIFNSIFKILFDQQLQLVAHEKALELIKHLLDCFQNRQDKYFIDRQLFQHLLDQQNTGVPQANGNPSQSNNYTLEQIHKELTHTHRYKMLDRLFQTVGMKFAQIRKSLKACKEMLIKQKKWGIVRKTTPLTGIVSMPCNNEFLNDQFIDKLDNYIRTSEIDIDQNLIMLPDQTATQVYTFDDEEEFHVDGQVITNYSQFIDYAKELKFRIIDQLNEVISKLLQCVQTTNKEIVTKSRSPNKVGPLYNANTEQRHYPYLTNLQCHYMSKILKNALMIFEELHDPQRNHFEIFDYRRKTISQFMSMLLQIQDPVNFKNIFEPNSKLLLRISVNIIKTCPDNNCIPILLQEHITAQSPPETTMQRQVSFKVYIEYLLHLFFKELQTTQELPTQFGYVRGGVLVQLNQKEKIQQKDQDEYISIIQKLIRIPIRLFPRAKQIQGEEPVVKPLIKQLILFFVKKSHETYYPIDYLGLLLSLVKRIQAPQPFPEQLPETLYKYFQQLCDRYDRNDRSAKPQDVYHRINLSGVNIVLNMFELFQTGIVEIQDIVAEVVANFPLQQPNLIHLAKNYPILGQCLFRALHNITLNENQVIQKTLQSLDIIVLHLSLEELQVFFGDLLQPFIEKLISFPSEYKMSDILNRNVHFLTDASFKAVRILSKLGPLVRKADWPLEVRRNHNDALHKRNQYLELQIEGLEKGIQINLTELVRCSAEIIQNVLENQLASYLFKQSSIQHSYQVVKSILLRYYKMPIVFKEDLYKFVIPDGMALDMKLEYERNLDNKQLDEIINDEELISLVTKVFIGLSNFHNIIQTLTTATFHRIKEDVENIVTTLSEMFFIQMADEQVLIVRQLEKQYGNQPPSMAKQYEIVEELVGSMMKDKTPGIKWMAHLFRCLSKRYMLTVEETMNFKDFYAQQHEFIWNKLLIGNCLRKYKTVLLSSAQDRMIWAFKIQLTVLFRLWEEFVYDKFLRQTQLQKDDERRRKIQIVQSFGGTMIPSEGLNNRSISMELFIEIQNLRPTFQEFMEKPGEILGLPYIPDQRILECAFILQRQLPQSIKVVSQLLTRQLLVQTFQNMIANMKYQVKMSEEGDQLKALLEPKLVQCLHIVVENLETIKATQQQLCLELLDLVINQLFEGNAARVIYLSSSLNDYLPFVSRIVKDPNQLVLQDWVNIPFGSIDSEFYDKKNTILRKIVLIIKQQLGKIPSFSNAAEVQTATNGYNLLTFLIQKYGIQQGQRYYLFGTLSEDKQSFDPQLEILFSNAMKTIQINEEIYGKHSKLINTSSQEEANSQGTINHCHYLDDLEYKINIEHIDFEIKRQSHLIASIFGFLKSLSTLSYIHNQQKTLQKSIERNQQNKPQILIAKFKTVEVLYEGLIRVEQSIRSTAYKYLQELSQQEGVNNDKTLFENDERLRKVMKPLLTCVQLDIYYYVPPFLKSLKLIIKIFSKVFHRALSDRLLTQLQKIVENNVSSLNQASCPTFGEWNSASTSQPIGPESLNIQMSIISGLLKLFQHLTTTLAVPAGQTPTVVSQIISNTHALKRNYVSKVSRSQLGSAIQRPLVKFLNTQAANHFEYFQIPLQSLQIQQALKQVEISIQQQNGQANQQLRTLNDQLAEKLKFIKTIRQILSDPCAYPLREKTCREKSAFPSKLEKFSQFIDQVSSSVEKGLLTMTGGEMNTFHLSTNQPQKLINVLSELKVELVQFGYQQCKRNPVWLKKSNDFLKNCVVKTIDDLRMKLKTNSLINQQKEKRIQNQQILLSYNQLMLPISQINALLNRQASILKNYLQQNEENELAITYMLRLLLYGASHDKVKKWLLNVAQFRSVELRSKILKIWMENFNYKQDDEQMNQVQMISGYYIVYPILFYANQRQDLHLIANIPLFAKIKEVNDELHSQYKNVTQVIEWNAPYNYPYPQRQQKSVVSEVNAYYKQCIIEMIQITNYLICFQDSSSLPCDLKISFLQFAYDMINKQDKLVAYYAYLYFSKCLKKNGLIQNDPVTVRNRYLKTYNKAVKQLDEILNTEHEIYWICKKIINVVLPALEEMADQQVSKDWITSTQNLLKQESNNLDPEGAQKVSRFWSMFIRNHRIFHKHHEQFTIHIINSMQQIGFYTPGQQATTQQQPSLLQNQQMYKRIALDMAFLQVEWKTQHIRKQLLEGGEAAKQKFRSSFFQTEPSNSDESLSSDIYQSFFIKQSLRAHNVEDIEAQKRALYLLKKILIIVPLTNHKLNIENVKKNVANTLSTLYDPAVQQGVRHGQHQQTTPHFRFFMVVLNVLLIILEFQPPNKVVPLLIPYYEIILNMSQLPEQIQQQSMRVQQSRPQAAIGPRPPQVMNTVQANPAAGAPRGTNPQERQQTHNQLLATDHTQLIHSCYSIFKKLIRVAKSQPEQSQGCEQFLNLLFDWCKEIILNHQTLRRQPPQPMPAHHAFMMGAGPRPTPSQQQPLRVNLLSVFILKLYFNYDMVVVRPLIAHLKRIAEIIIDYLRQKDKGDQFLDNMKKHSQPKRQFQFKRMHIEACDDAEEDVKQYQNADLSSYMEDYMQLKEDFPFGVEKSDQLYMGEDFPEQQKLKYHLYRSGLQKILRMIAFNFDEMKDQREQYEFLQILLVIIEVVADYELKLECIAVFRMLFLNFKDDSIPERETRKKEYLDVVAKHFSPIRAQQAARELSVMESNMEFKPSKMQPRDVIHFFFDLQRLQTLFDKKIDQRSSDSYDNQHQKIQDLKVIKLYYMFLCEYLIFKQFKVGLPTGFYTLRSVLDKQSTGGLREFRKLLTIISKLSTSMDYLTFMYKGVLDLYGYSFDRFMSLLLNDAQQKEGTEGEEVMLMGIKFFMLSRGTIQPKQQLLQQHTKIRVTVVPKTPEAQMREQVLQKYLAIYHLKQSLSQKRFFNAALKLITSEYLPSIVIYNLSYIPIQDIPQQPLRECIISSAALELMGTAANVSSRLLRPLFTQLLSNLCKPTEASISRFSDVLDYLQSQPTAYGMQSTLSQFLVNFCLALLEKRGVQVFLENQQIAQGFNNLVKTLVNKQQLAQAQYLLEGFFRYLQNDQLVTPLQEDVLVQLQGVFIEQHNEQAIFGSKYYQVTSPHAKQILLQGHFRQPGQQYLTILNNFANANLEESDSSATYQCSAQREIENQIIQQAFAQALDGLNQWSCLKNFEAQSKVDQSYQKVEMGLREKLHDVCQQGWKELSDLRLVVSQQSDQQFYTQAFFRLLELTKDENMGTQHNRVHQGMSSVEPILKNAQIINSYKYIRQLPKLTLSYDQQMSSPLIWGNRYLTFVSNFQCYTELDELLKLNGMNYQSQYAAEAFYYEHASNTFRNALTAKRQFQERQPLNSDPPSFVFGLVNARQVQSNLAFQRFNAAITQIVNNVGPNPPIQLNPQMYFAALVDYKTFLYPMRYYQRMGILEVYDESQVVKDMPKLLGGIVENVIKLERIKFKTKSKQEIENNIQELGNLIEWFSKNIGTFTQTQTSSLPNNLSPSIVSAEDAKNFFIMKAHRLKLINHCYKVLKFESNSMQLEHQNWPKLDSLFKEAEEFCYKTFQNHLKFWREIQIVYQLAHRKYNNNLSFAQQYITIAPLSAQYKPNKYPLSLIHLFNIINITNPTDSLVQDSFCQVIHQLSPYILQRYTPQLLITCLKSRTDAVKQAVLKCLKATNKIHNSLNESKLFDLLNNLDEDSKREKSISELLLRQSSEPYNFQDHLFNIDELFKQIHSLPTNRKGDKAYLDQLEEIIYHTGKLLDQRIFQIQDVESQSRLLKIINLIQKNKEFKDILKKIGEFPQVLQINSSRPDNLKAISQVYEEALKEFYSKLNGQPFSYSAIIGPATTLNINITQLYKLNSIFKDKNIPMFCVTPKLMKQALWESVSMISIFPTVSLKIIRRKQIVRILSILGSNEKKYFFSLKRNDTKNFTPNQMLERLLSEQFIKFTDAMCQNYSEATIRNIQCYMPERYQFYIKPEKSWYTIEQFYDEQQPLSAIVEAYQTVNQLGLPFYQSQVPVSLLHDQMLKFCKTVDTFVQIRKIVLTNLGVQYALSFLIAQGNHQKQLDNLIIQFSEGRFFQRKYKFHIQRDQMLLYDPYAIRYSRNFEYLCGDQNLAAYVGPAFLAVILGMLEYQSENLPEYLMQLYWDLGLKDYQQLLFKIRNIALNPKTDFIESKFDRLIELSKQLYKENAPTWLRNMF